MSAIAEDAVERKVGRLVIRTATQGDRAGYRHAADAPVLELRCQPTATGPVRSGTAVALAAVLAAGLLVFAIIVRSGPAIGAVSVAIGALGWLVLASRRGRAAAIVRIGADELCVIAPDRKLRAPIADVESVALGNDQDALRTVWARVKGEGRVLLLDGLTTDEADVALERIDAALRR